MTTQSERRKRTTQALLLAARQLYNELDFFQKYFTSTVILNGYVCWMNDRKTGYYKVNVNSGIVLEVDTIEDTTGKYVRTEDLVSVSMAMANFINISGTMAGYSRPLPQISHQVLDGIGCQVTTRGANETDLTLYASHDVYLELAKLHVLHEQIYWPHKLTHYALKDGRTLAITIEEKEVNFAVLRSQSVPVKTGILEMRNALMEFVLYCS